MKKFTLAASAALLCLALPAQAAGSLYINGRESDAFLSVDGRDMLIARRFFEDSGYTVQWSSVDRRVTAYDSANKITMFADNNMLFINQSGTLLDANAEIVNGSLIMPVAAAQLALDADVLYSGGDIYITSNMIHDSSAWQYDVLALTNSERAKYGLSPLIWNASLAEAAGSRTRDMAQRNYFSHYTPEGKSPFDCLEELGLRFSYAAENIAAGQPDPQSVVTAWMASEGHRKNILDPNLRELGAAFTRGGIYGIYWAQEFATTG